MRTILLLAILALAACNDDDLAVPGSPAEAEVRAAVADYFSHVSRSSILQDPDNLKGARLTKVSRCEALGSDFMCPVSFQRPHQPGELKRFVWLSQQSDGWIATAISSDR
jgi:hypothetical protein